MAPEAHTQDALPDGWMGKKPVRWLERQAARHRRIVEVGVWKGRTTKLLAQTTNRRAKIWAIDHWKGVPDDPNQQATLYEAADASGDAVYAEFCQNLKVEIAAGRVLAVRLDTKAAAAHLLETRGRTFDMIFLDADHRYEAIRADIEAFTPLLVRGGLLCGHDYSERWPGVVQAVDELVPQREVYSSIWSAVVR